VVPRQTYLISLFQANPFSTLFRLTHGHSLFCPSARCPRSDRPTCWSRAVGRWWANPDLALLGFVNCNQTQLTNPALLYDTHTGTDRP
jgi:hypothetical protein